MYRRVRLKAARDGACPDRPLLASTLPGRCPHLLRCAAALMQHLATASACSSGLPPGREAVLQCHQGQYHAGGGDAVPQVRVQFPLAQWPGASLRAGSEAAGRRRFGRGCDATRLAAALPSVICCLSAGAWRCSHPCFALARCAVLRCAAGPTDRSWAWGASSSCSSRCWRWVGRAVGLGGRAWVGMEDPLGWDEGPLGGAGGGHG